MAKWTLYLGTTPRHFKPRYPMIHYPLIKIVKKPLYDFSIRCALDDFHEYTHVILTSQHTVAILFEYLSLLHYEKDNFKDKIWMCIGQTTEEALLTKIKVKTYLPAAPTQEGIIDRLSTMHLEDAYVFVPRSSRARSSLSKFLKKCRVRHQLCDLYDTIYQDQKLEIPFSEIGEIVFTSPSTVDAFFLMYHHLPQGVSIETIGPITKAYLEDKKRL